MKPRDFVDQRRRQYLAQTLEHFERQVEPKLGADASDAIADFKQFARRKFGALGADCIAVLDLEPEADLNALGIEIRESLGVTRT